MQLAPKVGEYGGRSFSLSAVGKSQNKIRGGLSCCASSVRNRLPVNLLKPWAWDLQKSILADRVVTQSGHCHVEECICVATLMMTTTPPPPQCGLLTPSQHTRSWPSCRNCSQHTIICPACKPEGQAVTPTSPLHPHGYLAQICKPAGIETLRAAMLVECK